MAQTQVILLERVGKLGQMGDTVTVKSGYARNFLLPQGKALRATKNNIAYFEAQKKQLEADSATRKKEAEALAKKLDGTKVPLIRQASEAGQLYGSVTSRDIAGELSAVSKVDVDRTMVQLNQNYKMVGLFPIEIMLHPEVVVEITINIARSVEEAEIQAKTGKALIADAAQVEEAAPAEEAAAADDSALDGALEEVLEEGALEAEKEKQAAEAEAEEEAKAKEEKAKAKAAEKAAKKAAEEEAAEAEDSAEEEKTEE